jgi:SEC-C motif domain protein
MNLCPCGSKQSFTACCDPYISGKTAAPTPEALMRSRYSAFTQANIDYIMSTMKGDVLKDFDPETARKWAASVKWLELEIINAPAVNKGDTIGYVEFVAKYLLKDRLQNIHERSEFLLDNDRWYYVDGQDVQRDNANKVGRNDVCPCGSEKKFKKCCGV